MDNNVKGYIGKKTNKCKVCGCISEHPCYEVKEMFLGTQEPFIYFECNSCQCMQILHVPKNLNKYYPDNYYSFNPQLPDPLQFPPSNKQKFPEKILDVGCGSGKWLIERAMEGYDNLYGCDPLILSILVYTFFSRMFDLSCLQ